MRTVFSRVTVQMLQMKTVVAQKGGILVVWIISLVFPGCVVSGTKDPLVK